MNEEAKGTKEKPVTCLSAAIHFFGLREGQGRMQFGKEEWIVLPNPDKLEVANGLVANGYHIDPKTMPMSGVAA